MFLNSFNSNDLQWKSGLMTVTSELPNVSPARYEHSKNSHIDSTRIQARPIWHQHRVNARFVSKLPLDGYLNKGGRNCFCKANSACGEGISGRGMANSCPTGTFGKLDYPMN